MSVIDNLKNAPVDAANKIGDHAMDRIDETVDRVEATIAQELDAAETKVAEQISTGLAQAGQSALDLLNQARKAAGNDLAALTEYQIVIRIGIERKPS